MDRLAEKKEQERVAFKRPKIEASNDGDAADAKRQYRDRQDDTPSYGGGVDREARDRQKRQEKERRHRHQKNSYFSSKDERSNKGQSRDDGRRSKRDENDRRSHHDRSERGSSSGKNSDDRGRHDRSDRSDRRTDRRSERSERGRDWESETPRRREDEDIDTPYLKGKSTPHQNSWEEDDYTPKKTSSWDMPTPGTHRSREDDYTFNVPSSRRDGRDRSRRDRDNRRYEKETPLPTPSYKRNSWNKKEGGRRNGDDSRSGH